MYKSASHGWDQLAHRAKKKQANSLFVTWELTTVPSKRKRRKKKHHQPPISSVSFNVQLARKRTRGRRRKILFSFLPFFFVPFLFLRSERTLCIPFSPTRGFYNMTQRSRTKTRRWKRLPVDRPAWGSGANVTAQWDNVNLIIQRSWWHVFYHTVKKKEMYDRQNGDKNAGIFHFTSSNFQRCRWDTVSSWH